MRQFGPWLPQLVEEGVSAGLHGGDPGGGGVLQEARHQVDGLRGSARAEYLLPWVRLDLRELELRVVGVHLLDLLSGRRAQNLKHKGILVHVRELKFDGTQPWLTCHPKRPDPEF